MEKLVVEKHNEVYVKIYCEAGIRYELQEYFTFSVPGARFMPQVRNKFWDGKIRLFNVATQLIYGGLLPYIRQFAFERGYEVEVDTELYDSECSVVEVEEFAKGILKGKLEARDYQIQAIAHAIRTKRSLLLSPTASGKSLIIYLLSQYLISKGNKILVVVPTTSLVYQMQTDFQGYGYTDDVRVVTGIEEKTWRNTIKEDIVVTTWQSIYKMPKPWFNQFGAIMGDEAHNFKSKSLTSIMTKLESCRYRYGFTGTLDGTQTHKLVLEGLFGAVKKVTTTAELIDKGTLADLNIKCIVLGYPDDVRQQHKKDNFRDELDYIVTNKSRNNFIKNLILSLKGNTLALYQYVEKHGKVLYNDLEQAGTKTIHYVSGEVSGEDREDIRRIVENSTDDVIVASYGTFSTGINIVNLDNVVFVSPSKSRIRVLQSIGRGLRKGDKKSTATLYDIADDLTWKSHKNYTLQHFAERVKYYNDEKFNYKIYQVQLNL